MRGKLGKAVRTQFDKRMKGMFAQFSVTTDDRALPGSRLYRWQMTDQICAFILLQMGRADEFTIELGWSRDGRFPFESMLGFPVDFPDRGIYKDKPSANGFRFRLVTLWDPHGNDFWELVAKPSLDESLRRLDLVSRGIEVDPPVDVVLGEVPRAVEDAIQKIEKYAIPYLAATAQLS